MERGKTALVGTHGNHTSLPWQDTMTAKKADDKCIGRVLQHLTRCAGPRMDPPLSVSIAPAHNPAATAAPKPEPEPPMANSTYAALLLSGWANKRMFCSCSSARVQF